MLLRISLPIFAVFTLGLSAQAQSPALSFDQAAYVTCREAHAMTPDARRALATFLAERSARRYGVAIPNDDRGTQLAFLIRAACTLSPDAYLYAAVDRAVQAELARLPKR